MERPRRDERVWAEARFFDRPTTAHFITRLNRFLVRCERGGRVIDAFLPNPGRLLELLLPGRCVYLVREKGEQARKTGFTAVAIEREGVPVMVHTHRTNDVARFLLHHRLVPGLERANVKASEITRGRSRFDFLLQDGGERTVLEVKSCTLFGNQVAMFPDAVTERGSRHLKGLVALTGNGTRGAVLFVVHWPHARVFMPDYHTDPVFAKTLLEVRHTIRIIPISVRWNSDLTLGRTVELLDIPWNHIEQESKDRGSYLLILRVPRAMRLSVGRLGMVTLTPGFYVYVGSAMGGLERRMARHRRIAKRPHWHIDALRAVAEFRSVLAIRASTRLECDIARALRAIGEWSIPGFGSTDCRCETHLFGLTGDPFQREDFHRLVQSFRMDRYESGGCEPAHVGGQTMGEGRT
jgi:sugar fermentation stimulation protein A